MPRRTRPPRSNASVGRASKSEIITLRIIAGDLRSRKVQFECDQRTRPMKDRTREAVLNLLGGTFEGAIAFDLFGGSGILAFESISRGAEHAVIWEILRPGAATIRQLAGGLGIGERVSVLATDVLQWTRDWAAKGYAWDATEVAPETQAKRWVVFCCPPYALWEPAGEELKEMMQTWYQAAPIGSLFAIELEVETPESWLPNEPEWDIRTYAPAKIAIAEKS